VALNKIYIQNLNLNSLSWLELTDFDGVSEIVSLRVNHDTVSVSVNNLVLKGILDVVDRRLQDLSARSGDQGRDRLGVEPWVSEPKTTINRVCDQFDGLLKKVPFYLISRFL